MKLLLLPLLLTGFYFLFETISRNGENEAASVEIEMVNMATEMSVGNQIRVIRESRGLSRSDLAAATGLEVYQLQLIESGQATPTRDILVQMEELLEENIILDLY
jgi:ribosome-binding protein aMBF1 (putative translation factor)